MLQLPFPPIGVYTVQACNSRFAFLISLMQTAEGRDWWIANLDSSEIRSRAACWRSKRAIHSATQAGYILYEIKHRRVQCTFSLHYLDKQTMCVNVVPNSIYCCPCCCLSIEIVCTEFLFRFSIVALKNSKRQPILCPFFTDYRIVI